jgi:hypothetical protein
MTKPEKFARCIFLPYSSRDNVAESTLVYDVSSYAEEPFCQLSPMYAHGGIPIPGMSGEVSDSVEGIWQGLKIIRGKIDKRFFTGKGAKRGGGKPAGHQFGKKTLDIVEARYKIYRPAYEWMLDNRIDPGLLNLFFENARRGLPQYFHDVVDNGDMNEPEFPLAHAALLVQYLNRRLNEVEER